MTLFVNDPDFVLHVGGALETLQAMPTESVHCCVTSPPYWGLRDYSTDGQLGLEPTPDEYITRMVAVFREVRRVLRADGTLWLNIGDSYASNWGMGAKRDSSWWSTRSGELEGKGWGDVETAIPPNSFKPGRADGLKVKDLCGIPWRVAFALQADGWYLRSDIIWSKPNPMPESVTDRPTKAHEYLFLLTKSPRYFYDADAIREPHESTRWGGRMHKDNPSEKYRQANGNEASAARVREDRAEFDHYPEGGRNKRSVWEIATEPYPDAHFATFPQALVEPCIKAGTSEHGCCPVCGAPWEREMKVEPMVVRPGPKREAWQASGDDHARTAVGGTVVKDATRKMIGWRPSCLCPPVEKGVLPDQLPRYAEPVPAVVLDPFLGSGTTAQVARRLGRKSIGIELNEEYAQLAARRLQQQSLFA